MIAKILAKGTAAAIVGYVMREFHDKEQYTADTWRVIDSDGILGNDYRRIVDSFDIGASLNKRISKPIGHIAVSFDKADLPRLTDDFMVQLAKEYMERVNILDRFETAMRELREESASMSDVKVNADGSPSVDADTLEAYTKKLNEFNRLINDKLNYIFAADVSSAAFGMQSPLSLVGDEGKFLFEVFLEAALLAVREKIEASADLVEIGRAHV